MWVCVVGAASVWSPLIKRVALLRLSCVGVFSCFILHRSCSRFTLRCRASPIVPNRFVVGLP
ncbi:unnamed protein product [Arabidopsis halleri]